MAVPAFPYPDLSVAGRIMSCGDAIDIGTRPRSVKPFS